MLYDGVEGQDNRKGAYYTLDKASRAEGYLGESPCAPDYNNGQFAAWKDPQMTLKHFEYKAVGDAGQVCATYDMPGVSAKLDMTYTLRPDGQLIVNEKLTTDPSAKQKPYMFRYGMQLVMPKEYSHILYYGRGPGENYSDRHWGDRIGVYSGDLEQRPLTQVHIQERQCGLAGVDSWGHWPEPEVLIPYGDRNFTFVINPVTAAK